MKRPTLVRSVAGYAADENTKRRRAAYEGVGRISKIRFLGSDVHANTISVAVAEPNGEVRSIGTIPNRLESVRKLVQKLGPAKQLRAYYEAGPTGYVLYWQLTAGWGCLSGRRAEPDAGESRRPRQDGSPRCRETGTLLSGW